MERIHNLAKAYKLYYDKVYFMERKHLTLFGVALLGVILIFLLHRTLVQNSSSMQEITTPIKTTALYKTSLPSADSSERLITLELKSDNTATFTQDYRNDNPPIIQTGTWDQNNTQNYTITLTTKDSEPLNTPVTMLFTYNPINAGVLTLQDPEQAGWGSEGLTLQNILPWADKKWRWSETIMSDGAKTTTDEKKSFSITFTKEGTAQITTDCNHGHGGYSLTSDSNMTIGPVARTLMYCEGSQETPFYNQIEAIGSYHLQDGKLHLLLKFDSGTMTFEE